MKRLLSFLFVCLITTLVMAVPAKRTTFTHTQSDGTKLTLMLVGDEHLHYYLNVNTNEKMERGEDGDYHVISETNFSERKQKANVRRNAANKSRIERLNARRKTSVTTNGQKRVGSVSGGITGNKKGLVILVNFSDKSMVSSHTQSVFNNQFNQEGYSDGGHLGSVHDYFYDQSYGQFNLTFDVIGPVTVSNEMSYYGGNDSNGEDMYPATMVSEAIKLVDSQVNFADYDWDGDGEVDQVYVIYAGNGEAAGGGSNTIWPHEWNLSSAKYYGKGGNGAVILDGVTIDTYACSCELSGSSGTTLNGIGTACHEFSHCLGYPDFYDTDYSGGIGMDCFDVMDAGSYNGPNTNGEVPCGYTAYERYIAGWLEPEILDEAATITDMPALNDEGAAYIIFNEKETKEYFFLENRQSKKWFKYFSDVEAGHGLFITHVDEDATVWSNNKPNDDPDHQRMTWVAADGKYGTYSSSYKSWTISEAEGKGDFFPGTNNETSFNGKSHSSVGGKFFNLNTNNTYYTNHALTEISESDGKISFLVDGGGVVDDGSRYTITFNAGTGSCSTPSWKQSSYGESVQLPDAYINVDGWEYIGWTDAVVKETSTKPSTIYGKRNYYCPQSDVTLYALYKKTTSSGTGSGYYTLDYNAEESLQNTSLGYGNAVEYTAKDGSTWVVKAFKSSGMQINKGKNASIKVPNCPGNISSIVVTDGTAKVLSFSDTDYTGNNTPTSIAQSSKSTNATIDLSGQEVKTGFIYTTDGATTITKIVVNYGGGSGTLYATNPGDDGLVKPTISFESNTLNIKVGDVKEDFKATVTNSTGKVTYTSSNELVATVGPENGRVVAKGIGTTTITATVAAVDGVSKPARASYTLTVTMPALESIAVTTLPTKLTYLEDESFEKGDMVVTATYVNGYKEEVTNYTLVPSTDVALRTTDTSILVSYTEDGITKITTIPITVTEKPKYTITFNAGSGTCDNESLSEASYQSGITLPTATGIIDEWKFAGWSTVSVAEATINRPINLLEAGTHYEPKGDITLYAVYSRNESSGGSGDYELVTKELDDWSGDYLIACSSTIFADGRIGGTVENGIGAINISANPGDNLSGTTVAAEWGDTYHVTLERKTGSNTYYLKTQDGVYNYRIKNDNGLDSSNDLYANDGPNDHPIKITFNSSSDIVLGSKTSTTGSNQYQAVFQYNTSGAMFRFYKNGGQSKIYLYKKHGTIGVTTYLSNPTDKALTVPTIAFNETDAKAMLVGDTYTNVATAEGSTGAITYESSDTKVVTVDENGQVTAVGVGNATITASVAAVLGVSKSAQTTYDITVTMPALESIAVTNGPTKTTYDEGDALSNAGLVLTATYANGYTQEITEEYVTNPAEGAMLAADVSSIQVNYTEGEVTKTTTYEITVNELPKYAVTFLINGHEKVVSQTVANTGVTAPQVDDVNDYTFVGWSTTDVTEEGTSKPTMVTLTDGKYTPKSPTTLYAVYKREKGQFAEGFTLDLTYNDVEYAVSTHDSKNKFTSTASNKLTLYYNYDEQKQKGYLWYKTGTNTPNYVYNTSSTKADISSTTKMSDVLTSWTMTENDRVVILKSSTGRYLALNANDGSKPIRAYGENTTTGQYYPHDWNITYTGEKFSLGSTSYYTSHPATTIISVANLIDSIINGENKTVEDVQNVVDKVLNK